MKQYIETKLVQAEPAWRLISQRGADIVPKSETPVFEDRAIIEDGYMVKYSDEYLSWIPKNVFESEYRETDGMCFGVALDAMKMGRRVARISWVNAYVFLGTDVEFRTDANLSEFEESGAPACDMLVLRSTEGELLPGWLPSHPDILAEDWILLEDDPGVLPF